MKHNDVTLFETSAICRYLDIAFEGPSLVPASASEQGLMEQWISTLNSYFYPRLVTNHILHYVFPRGVDGKPGYLMHDRESAKNKRGALGA